MGLGQGRVDVGVNGTTQFSGVSDQFFCTAVTILRRLNRVQSACAVIGRGETSRGANEWCSESHDSDHHLLFTGE